MNLKVSIDDMGIQIAGANSLSELCSAVTILTEALYDSMDDKNKSIFKMMLTKAFEDGIPFMDIKSIAELSARNITMSQIEEFLKGLSDDD